MRIVTQNVSFEWDHTFDDKVLEVGQLMVQPIKFSIDYKIKNAPIIKTGRKGTGIGEINYPCGVVTDEYTNNIYVADFSSNRVCVFNYQGKFLFQFNGNNDKTIKMSLPIGIAIYENKVFVSQLSSHSIQIYNLDGTFIQQFGSQGTGQDQLNGPYGLAISPLNGDIYVTDYSNNRVQIFSKVYKHKSFLGVNQLKYPVDVKLTQQEIFVLDRNTPCVHVYDYNNNLLRSIIPRTGDGYKIKDAYCMHVDIDSNIIISDHAAHRVYVFNSTGDIIHQIGNNGNMFTQPLGGTIDSLSRLIVVNTISNAMIQIF